MGLLIRGWARTGLVTLPEASTQEGQGCQCKGPGDSSCRPGQGSSSTDTTPPRDVSVSFLFYLFFRIVFKYAIHSLFNSLLSLSVPADLCLLGCIFLMADYQDDPDTSEFVPDWKRMIREYGGELEDCPSSPRLTHVLCRTQDSEAAQRGLREGRRLVTAPWLSDTIARKKVLPPWKAVHFPLPAGFAPPCENFLLTVTGFADSDREWVKLMIRAAGAKYTGCLSKHNDAIICLSGSGDKFSKAKDWKVPTVTVQWLNEVLFGTGSAEQCLHNPKYSNFRAASLSAAAAAQGGYADEPLRIDYNLVPHLMGAWKNPIRVTPETYQKFKANPPARIKRKAERQRLEREAKRMREAEEQQQIQQQQFPGQQPNGMQAQAGQQNMDQSQSQPQQQQQQQGDQIQQQQPQGDQAQQQQQQEQSTAPNQQTDASAAAGKEGDSKEQEAKSQPQSSDEKSNPSATDKSAEGSEKKDEEAKDKAPAEKDSEPKKDATKPEEQAQKEKEGEAKAATGEQSSEEPKKEQEQKKVSRVKKVQVTDIEQTYSSFPTGRATEYGGGKGEPERGHYLLLFHG